MLALRPGEGRARGLSGTEGKNPKQKGETDPGRSGEGEGEIPRDRSRGRGGGGGGGRFLCEIKLAPDTRINISAADQSGGEDSCAPRSWPDPSAAPSIDKMAAVNLCWQYGNSSSFSCSLLRALARSWICESQFQSRSEPALPVRFGLPPLPRDSMRWLGIRL